MSYTFLTVTVRYFNNYCDGRHEIQKSLCELSKINTATGSAAVVHWLACATLDPFCKAVRFPSANRTGNCLITSEAQSVARTQIIYIAKVLASIHCATKPHTSWICDDFQFFEFYLDDDLIA